MGKKLSVEERQQKITEHAQTITDRRAEVQPATPEVEKRTIFEQMKKQVASLKGEATKFKKIPGVEQERKDEVDNVVRRAVEAFEEVQRAIEAVPLPPPLPDADADDEEEEGGAGAPPPPPAPDAAEIQRQQEVLASELHALIVPMRTRTQALLDRPGDHTFLLPKTDGTDGLEEVVKDIFRDALLRDSFDAMDQEVNDKKTTSSLDDTFKTEIQEQLHEITKVLDANEAKLDAAAATVPDLAPDVAQALFEHFCTDEGYDVAYLMGRAPEAKQNIVERVRTNPPAWLPADQVAGFIRHLKQVMGLTGPDVPVVPPTAAPGPTADTAAARTATVVDTPPVDTARTTDTPRVETPPTPPAWAPFDIINAEGGTLHVAKESFAGYTKGEKLRQKGLRSELQSATYEIVGATADGNIVIKVDRSTDDTEDKAIVRTPEELDHNFTVIGKEAGVKEEERAQHRERELHEAIAALTAGVTIEDFALNSENVKAKIEVVVRRLLPELAGDASTNVVNAYYGDIMMKVEEVLRGRLAQIKKEKKESHKIGSWFAERAKQLVKGVYSGGLYGIAMRGAKALLRESLGGYTGAAVGAISGIASAAGQEGIARIAKAAAGKLGFKDPGDREGRIKELLATLKEEEALPVPAEAPAHGGEHGHSGHGHGAETHAPKPKRASLDATLTHTLRASLESFVAFDRRRKDTLQDLQKVVNAQYDVTDEEHQDLSRLIALTEQARAESGTALDTIVRERQELLQTMIRNTTIEAFTRTMVARRIHEEVRDSEGNERELTPEEKRQIEQYATLSVEREMNALLLDVVANEKRSQIDAASKNGTLDTLLASKPLALVRAGVNGAVSGYLAGTGPSTAAFYMGFKRITGSLKMELSRVQAEERGKTIKSPEKLLQELKELRATAATQPLDADRVTALIEDARVSIATKGEADRIAVEEAIDVLQRRLIREQAKKDVAVDAVALAKRLIVSREQTVKAAAERINKDRAEKSWIGKEGLALRYMYMIGKDFPEFLKITGYTLGRGAEGAFAGAVGSGLVDLGVDAWNGDMKMDVATELNVIIDRAADRALFGATHFGEAAFAQGLLGHYGIDINDSDHLSQADLDKVLALPDQKDSANIIHYLLQHGDIELNKDAQGKPTGGFHLVEQAVPAAPDNAAKPETHKGMNFVAAAELFHNRPGGGVAIEQPTATVEGFERIDIHAGGNVVAHAEIRVETEAQGLVDKFIDLQHLKTNGEIRFREEGPWGNRITLEREPGKNEASVIFGETKDHVLEIKVITHDDDPTTEDSVAGIILDEHGKVSGKTWGKVNTEGASDLFKEHAERVNSDAQLDLDGDGAEETATVTEFKVNHYNEMRASKLEHTDAEHHKEEYNLLIGRLNVEDHAPENREYLLQRVGDVVPTAVVQHDRYDGQSVAMKIQEHFAVLAPALEARGEDVSIFSNSVMIVQRIEVARDAIHRLEAEPVAYHAGVLSCVEKGKLYTDAAVLQSLDAEENVTVDVSADRKHITVHAGSFSKEAAVTAGGTGLQIDGKTPEAFKDAVIQEIRDERYPVYSAHAGLLDQIASFDGTHLTPKSEAEITQEQLDKFLESPRADALLGAAHTAEEVELLMAHRNEPTLNTPEEVKQFAIREKQFEQIFGEQESETYLTIEKTLTRWGHDLIFRPEGVVVTIAEGHQYLMNAEGVQTLTRSGKPEGPMVALPHELTSRADVDAAIAAATKEDAMEYAVGEAMLKREIIPVLNGRSEIFDGSLADLDAAVRTHPELGKARDAIYRQLAAAGIVTADGKWASDVPEKERSLSVHELLDLSLNNAAARDATLERIAGQEAHTEMTQLLEKAGVSPRFASVFEHITAAEFHAFPSKEAFAEAYKDEVTAPWNEHDGMEHLRELYQLLDDAADDEDVPRSEATHTTLFEVVRDAKAHEIVASADVLPPAVREALQSDGAPHERAVTQATELLKSNANAKAIAIALGVEVGETVDFGRFAHKPEVLSQFIEEYQSAFHDAAGIHVKTDTNGNIVITVGEGTNAKEFTGALTASGSDLRIGGDTMDHVIEKVFEEKLCQENPALPRNFGLRDDLGISITPEHTINWGAWGTADQQQLVQNFVEGKHGDSIIISKLLRITPETVAFTVRHVGDDNYNTAEEINAHYVLAYRLEQKMEDVRSMREELESSGITIALPDNNREGVVVTKGDAHYILRNGQMREINNEGKEIGPRAEVTDSTAGGITDGIQAVEIQRATTIGDVVTILGAENVSFFEENPNLVELCRMTDGNINTERLQFAFAHKDDKNLPYSSMETFFHFYDRTVTTGEHVLTPEQYVTAQREYNLGYTHDKDNTDVYEWQHLRDGELVRQFINSEEKFSIKRSSDQKVPLSDFTGELLGVSVNLRDVHPGDKARAFEAVQHRIERNDVIAKGLDQAIDIYGWVSKDIDRKVILGHTPETFAAGHYDRTNQGGGASAWSAKEYLEKQIVALNQEANLTLNPELPYGQQIDRALDAIANKEAAATPEHFVANQTLPGSDGRSWIIQSVDAHGHLSSIRQDGNIWNGETHTVSEAGRDFAGNPLYRENGGDGLIRINMKDGKVLNVEEVTQGALAAEEKTIQESKTK